MEPKKRDRLSYITKNIKTFMPPKELETIASGMRGEDEDYFRGVLDELDKLIETMPKTYESENVPREERKAYLHYFNSSSDWYIVEKDREEEQIQAYGYVILNGDKQNAEFGYINIEELKRLNVELDLHFEPTLLTIITGEEFKKPTMAKEPQEQPVVVETMANTLAQSTPQEKQTLGIQNAELKDNQYVPQSETCSSVDTVVPASQRYEMLKAIETVDRRVNGVDEYVAEKLGYVVGKCSLDERQQGIKCLCDAFSAEQVDAIAVAIYNIEQKGFATIIGDQTGIGKGRIAAALTRYGVYNGKLPIMVTEKPNLFTDFFRDVVAIGSDDAIPLEFLQGMKEVKKRVKPVVSDEEGDEDVEVVDEESDTISEIELQPVYKKNDQYEKQIKTAKRMVPFIVNSKDNRTTIKDEAGNILYKGLEPSLLKSAISSQRIPSGYDFVLATYSQFRGAKESEKMSFLRAIAQGAIFIFDESHNASGASNTGKFLKEVLGTTNGGIFLSATFAKRPDNMPIYASKTSIKEANLNDEQLVAAITAGGVALQEILSSQLVAEGQMIRRERSFEGIKVDYVTLDAEGQKKFSTYNNLDKELEHRAISDTATEIIREIIVFQNEYVDPEIAAMDEIAKAEGKEVAGREGTAMGGVNNTPVFNGIFNLINQLLFSIKAESVADIAIEEMRKGKKPIIAFASTMESFLNQMTKEDGSLVEDNDLINADFSMVLKRRLESVLKYTEILPNGEKEYSKVDVTSMSPEFQAEYGRILEKINKSVVGISISPIDVIVNKIKNAGFSVEEVTGRTRILKVNEDGTAIVKSRSKPNVADAFRKFNDNEVDCLLINQSGSTGASAHALPTKKVKKEDVKVRVMIILQAELNINTEVQKRGRINRTGQILKPEYIYVTSSIPAEKRLMMMLQKKLKSLDANTTSSQKSTQGGVDTDDFLNKYGDVVVVEYLKENPALNEIIDDPLKLKGTDQNENAEGEKKGTDTPDKAHKVSGRIAILSVKEQETFYSEMQNRYKSLVEYLYSSGDYDLEVEDLNLQATSLEKSIAVLGKGGESVFSRNSILEKVEANALKKPYKKVELEGIIKASLENYTPNELNEKLMNDFIEFSKSNYELEANEQKEHYSNLKDKITSESKYIKLAAKGATEAELREYVQERQVAIESAKQLAATRLTEQYDNRKNVIKNLFNFFYVGKVIGYPTKTHSIDNSFVKGIFTGFGINPTAKNPYAPSAIKLNIALASSDKNVVLPGSKQDVVTAIKGITYSEIMSYDQENTLSQWDAIVKEKSKDRQVRYIVTGNILQAFGNESLKGKLISYTTDDGGTKKGILLPDYFDPNRIATAGGSSEALRVTVPIIKALPLIKSMPDGRMMTTANKISIMRVMGRSAYKIIMGLNNQRYGKYYLNPLLTGLVQNKQFVKLSGNMEAYVDERKIDNLVELLQNEYSETMNLPANQFDMIKGEVDLEYNDEVRYGQDLVIEKLTETDKAAAQEIEAEQTERELKRAQVDAEIKAETDAELDAKKSELSKAEQAQRLLKVENKLLKFYQLLAKA